MKLNILFLEEDVELRELTKYALTISEAHSVKTAGDFSEFLKCFRGPSFDLILMDYEMSGVTVSSVAEVVIEKNLQHKLPIMILRNHGVSKYSIEFEACGVVIINLIRPFDLRRLSQDISEAYEVYIKRMMVTKHSNGYGVPAEVAF